MSETAQNKTPFFKDSKRIFNYTHALLFITIWALLAFYESALLKRVELQSLFLYEETFFDSIMEKQAGLLSYVAAFFTQFLYYPWLGAAIFAAMLYKVYLLTKKVFEIPAGKSSVALILPALILAANTQLGYWIFYLKLPGYYFIPALGVTIILQLIWLSKKTPKALRALLVAVTAFFGYPLFGIYALVAALCMALFALADNIGGKNYKTIACDGGLSLAIAIAALLLVPEYWYSHYHLMSLEDILFAGLPHYQWGIDADPAIEANKYQEGHTIHSFWVPYILIGVTLLLLSITKELLKKQSAKNENKATVASALLIAVLIFFNCSYWYNDTNFRVENQQDAALWESDWNKVIELSEDVESPSRQIVMNKNIALLNIGRIGQLRFASSEDSSSEIDSPLKVKLTHTGGKMTYFQYGYFMFCYRWCMENAVEYGWKNEYMMHAVRCMIGESDFKLAGRYIKNLKSTLFHAGWAEEQEAIIAEAEKDIETLKTHKEYEKPIRFCNYEDYLAEDNSFVESFLMNHLPISAMTSSDRMVCEAGLMMAMTKKDVGMFFDVLNKYFATGVNQTKMPRHYQEAIILFANLKKIDLPNGMISTHISNEFRKFTARVQNYKGMKEEEMAPHFADFGNTYWYYYFFVRKIKSN